MDFALTPGEDPINRLGVGMVTYFKMTNSMMNLFIVLTIIQIPLLQAYGSYGASHDQDSYLGGKYMLGNLGGVAHNCA